MLKKNIKKIFFKHKLLQNIYMINKNQIFIWILYKSFLYK